jgi:hypothetical protein
MRTKYTLVSGTVMEGYRVASGPSRDYPYGTLEKQFPLFKQRGLDLERFYKGTLNVSIAPLVFEMLKPAYTFRQVAWTELHPPEDFSFSPCTLWFKDVQYPAYIYYPHPETKVRHFENASLMEILSVFIPEIKYGDIVDVVVEADEVRIRYDQNEENVHASNP